MVARWTLLAVTLFTTAVSAQDPGTAPRRPSRAEQLLQLAKLYEDRAEVLATQRATVEAARAREEALRIFEELARDFPAFERAQVQARLERSAKLVHAGEDVGSVGARALKAYRAHDFATACPLFRQVVDARPRDAGNWADLGLCLLKAGSTAEGLEVSARALKLADETGDAPARKAASYNLEKYAPQERQGLGAP